MGDSAKLAPAYDLVCTTRYPRFSRNLNIPSFDFFARKTS